MIYFKTEKEKKIINWLNKFSIVYSEDRLVKGKSVLCWSIYFIKRKRVGSGQNVNKYLSTDALKALSSDQGNSAAWNAFADKCAQLNNHVKTAQKQIDDVKKVSEYT